MYKSRLTIMMTALVLTLVTVSGLATFASDRAQVPFPQYTQSMTWQRYDNGFMLFNPADASITVFLGMNGGSVRTFSVQDYGHLPAFRPYPPAQGGRIAPVFGFGKVWANFADVGTVIGWPMQGEVAYDAQVTRGASGFHVWYSFPIWYTPPEARQVLVDYNAQTWSYSSTPPSPPVPTATPVPSVYIPPFSSGSQIASTFQSFEGGSMYWIAGTGDIIVLFNNGAYSVYHSYQYASLADNPFGGNTPANRLRPIFGFGKVWGNFPHVRSVLGWAVAPEQGQLTPFSRDDTRRTFRFDMPFGGFIEFDAGLLTWVQALP